MEIYLISENSIRIKTKRAAIVVDPTSSLRVKISAEIIALLNKTLEYSTSKIEGMRLLIRGAGEYEVEGVKISSFGFEQELSYKFQADNLEILLSKASSLKKLQEVIKESQILILNADCVVDESSVVELSPNVVILYGEKAVDLIKNLGEKSISPSNKYQVTREKLPEEMQVILLGQ